MVSGKRCEIGLGSLATRSLEEARKEAGDLRARARKGEDVLEQRRIENFQESIPSFEDRRSRRASKSQRNIHERDAFI
jgi:hypothetical protein